MEEYEIWKQGWALVRGFEKKSLRWVAQRNEVGMTVIVETEVRCSPGKPGNMKTERANRVVAVEEPR